MRMCVLKPQTARAHVSKLLLVSFWDFFCLTQAIYVHTDTKKNASLNLLEVRMSLDNYMYESHLFSNMT